MVQITGSDQINRPCRLKTLSGCLFDPVEGLFEIGDDIIDMLKAYRYTDKILLDATGRLLFVAQLLVRGGCRVDHQCLGISDVGQMARHLDTLDECLGRIIAPFHTKDRKSTRLNSSHVAISYAVF